MSYLVKHLEKSCSQTSMKGIGRIVKTKDKILKSIWVIGVALLFAICSYNVYDVLLHYFMYPTVTTITDRPLTSQQMDNDFVRSHIPPDITICNINPFRSDYQAVMETEDIPTFSEFLERLEVFVSNYGYKQLKNKLQTPSGYFQFIGPEDAVKISHSADQLIVDCNILVFSILGFETIPCNRSEQIRRFVTPEHFSCYTIGFNSDINQLLEIDRGFSIIGVEVILYADNFMEETDMHFMDRNAAAGAVVAVHEHATLYVPELHTVPVAVGTDTHIKLRWELRETLNKPYGDCLEDENEVWSIDGFRHRPNMYSCVSACSQKAVQEECRCIMAFYGATSTKVNLSKTPFCLDLSREYDDIVNRTKCMQEVMTTKYPECSEKECHSPCKEYKYDKKSYSAKWPRKSQQIPFYHKYIKGFAYDTKFDIFRTIVQLHEKGNISEVNRLLHKSTIIEDNFLKLSVYLSSIDVVTVRDHVGVTPYDLLAKIGGILNLYSGISFILIVEVIDLMYNILFSFEKKNATEDNTKSTVHPVLPKGDFLN